MQTLEELAYWNNNSYGSAIKISKETMYKTSILVCILTPATNWLIPFLKKLIRADFIYRY